MQLIFVEYSVFRVAISYDIA